MDYATGCWFLPDKHNGQGRPATTEHQIRRGLIGESAGSAAARRQRAGRRDRAMKLGRVVVGLAADGGPALGADVVVLAARGQHEQELLAGLGRPATARTEEAGRFELLEAVARWGHRSGVYTRPIMPAHA